MPAKHNRRHSKRIRSNSYDSEDRADVISISSTEPPECDDNSSVRSNQPLLVKIKKEPGVSDDEEEIELIQRSNMLQTIIPKMAPYAKYIYRVSAIYIFWILLHYVTAHMYVRYCATPTIYGFIISPFLISAPHCIAMRWVFAKGGTVIEGMWILVGTWLCSKIITQ